MDTVAWRSREARLSSCPRRKRKCSWPRAKKKIERPPVYTSLKPQALFQPGVKLHRKHSSQHLTSKPMELKRGWNSWSGDQVPPQAGLWKGLEQSQTDPRAKCSSSCNLNFPRWEEEMGARTQCLYISSLPQPTFWRICSIRKTVLRKSQKATFLLWKCRVLPSLQGTL